MKSIGYSSNNYEGTGLIHSRSEEDLWVGSISNSISNIERHQKILKKVVLFMQFYRH